MKIHPPFRRGIALVIVLVLLVLMLGLIMAFFSGVTTQRTFSRTAADAASTQQLADSAVNIVMSQIVDATGTSANGTTLAWASQPGMIRTYDDTALPKNFYKLYSSNAMIVPGSSFSISTDDPNNIGNGGWNSAGNVGIYTDLNSPVLVSDTSGSIVTSTTNGATVSSGTYSAIYPIMNPLAEGSKENPSESVEGFSLTSRPGSVITATGSGSVSESYDPTATVLGTGTTANPAPMPAKWLYVLSQGQIVAPDPAASANGVLKFTGSNANLVSGTNPIVGRVAFWADDETAKVNINTASEGTYWDVPRVFSIEDTGRFANKNGGLDTPGLAICQPVQKEFQRYPGHPATTSLSPVLGNFGLPVPPAPWPNVTGTFGLSTTGSASQLDPYYAITPRVVSGIVSGGTNGSYAGTMVMSGSVGGGSALTPDQDRLYASLDELMFSGSTTSVSGTTYRVTNPNISGTSTTTIPAVLTKSVFEKTKFFLTASSNAPEVTLFNTPRVSIWPVWDPKLKPGNPLTPYDALAAFCATTGTGSSSNPFYFTRANAHSGLTDYNNIQRNQALYKYLQALTTQNIPGFGGNFLTKYQTDRDQILTLIFDYIRCINLADSEPGAVPFAAGINTTGTNTLFVIDPNDPGIQPDVGDSNNLYNVFTDAPNLFPMGAGEVIPVQVSSNNTRGAGRCLTVAEADLLFYATGQNSANPKQTSKFRAVFLLQFASPMEGMAGMRSSLQYQVSGLNTLSVTVSGTNYSLNLPGAATNQINVADVQTYGGHSVGGVEGPAQGFYALGGHTFSATNTPPFDVSVKHAVSGGGLATYPFCSSTDVSFTPAALPATIAPRTFAFTGGSIFVKFYTQDTNELVQTINLSFPNGTFQIPDLITSINSGDTFPNDAGAIPSSFDSRLTSNYADSSNKLANLVSGIMDAAGTAVTSSTSTLASPMGIVRTGQMLTQSGQTSRVASDTVVGIQPAGANGAANATAGDIRMLAPLFTVPVTDFAPHKDYNDYVTTGSAPRWAHGLMTSAGIAYPGATFGNLVNASYMNGGSIPPTVIQTQSPYVPACVGAGGVSRVTGSANGDWDTGIGNMVDGAYMNKPDEGDSRIDSHLNAGASLTVPRYPYMINEPSYGFLESPPGGVYFSPNRQVPSALMFGSIPSGVQASKPWQTLLFNPKPEDPTHPGLATPPDYLIADLFWMPVVQPYAISQPFSTAGKINMNYQILPFTYIKRQTGLYAVMKATKFLAIPASDALYYKPWVMGNVISRTDNMGTNGAINPNRRRTINIPATLAAWDARFTGSTPSGGVGDIFKSATEICSLNLVPDSVAGEPTWTGSNMAAFWQTNNMTGTNVRDKPYVDIYPRLTTKSNTFTVHIWVQSLRQARANANAGQFVDPNGSAGGSKDSIASEYRGSTTIERYIDPNDPRLSGTDFAANPSQSIDPYYKFRVVGVKRFSP